MSVPDQQRGVQTDRILDRLSRLHPKRIDLSLGRIERLLARLDHPERTLPPVIHVAGTNGKGSVVAALRAITEAAGLRVHTYTSPHLVRFTERIRVAGRLIGEDALAAILEECEAANGEEPITFFEITTAAALLAFAREPADVCLLEVGLGGRLDATNVVDRPLVTAITPVSIDHTRFLGTSIASIAAEKAGIIKPDVPVVLGPQTGVADQVIRRRARQQSAPVFAHGRDWRVTLRRRGAGLVYEDADGRLELPALALDGVHQVANAGTAIAVLRQQDRFPLAPAALKAGLGWLRWPARLQPITTGPLADRLPDGAQLWLDGGHNPAAARVLKDHFRKLDGEDAPLVLIVGMMAGRDIKSFLKPFATLARQVVAVSIAGQDGAAPAAEVAAAAADVGLPGRMAGDLGSAIDLAVGGLAPDARPVVLIAGSLYLAGRVLAESGIEID